jgi:hypothetical protein
LLNSNRSTTKTRIARRRFQDAALAAPIPSQSTKHPAMPSTNAPKAQTRRSKRWNYKSFERSKQKKQHQSGAADDLDAIT